MAYSTDFSEYSTGAQPSDWTERWKTANCASEVVVNAGGFGGQSLSLTSSVGERQLLSWDDVDSVHADCDILVKFKPASGPYYYPLNIRTRCSGSATSETGYSLAVQTSSSGTLVISKYVSGTSTTIANVTGQLSLSYYYWIRFKLSGNNLYAKIWQDGSIEPVDWLITTSDSAISAAGWVGVGGVGQAADVDYFAVGFDGESPAFPSGYSIDKFGNLPLVSPSTGAIAVSVALGGSFPASPSCNLTGLRIGVGGTHSGQMRFAVYSGGSATDPTGATLLYDFGETTGSATNDYIDLTCVSPVVIPAGAFVWVFGKPNAGFYVRYTASASLVYAGNFQIARGRDNTDLNTDTATAFPSTMPSVTNSFSSVYIDWIALIEESTGTDYSLTADSGSYVVTGHDITTNRVHTTGWASYRNQGPWAFTEQPNVWGYLNNPRWTDTPEITKKHFPCGHWHKAGSGSEDVTGETICIEYVSELALDHYPYSSVNNGVYYSSDSLVYYNGYLYAAGGNSGIIERIDPETMTVEQRTVFDAGDVSSFRQIIIYGGVIYASIMIDGYRGNWIQKINIPAVGSGLDFTKSGEPMWAGSVCYGTDDNIYGSITSLNMNYAYIADFTPVTGALWESYWDQLPGDYAYFIEENADVYLGARTCGAQLCSFKIVDDLGYVFASGPESTYLSHSAYINVFNMDGEEQYAFPGNTTVGPNELAQLSSSSHLLATLRCTSSRTSLTARIVNAVDHDTSDTLITGLEIEGDSYDGSSYHRRTIWHSNDRIYSLHNTWPDQYLRIISISTTGSLIHQYSPGIIGGVGSFVILGNYVYVWTYSSEYPGYYSIVIKLTLNLDFVCQEYCIGGLYGGIYRESGRSIVSDGEQYIYNYHQPSGGSTGLITKWSTLPT